jgi:hypothetical protein
MRVTLENHYPRWIAMTRLILCGGMRGYEFYNAPAFESAAAQLRAAGYEVVSPVEMDRAAGFEHYTMTATPEQVAAFQAAFKAEIATSDGLALLPGWEKSEGVKAEVEEARRWRLPYVTVEAWIGMTKKETT